MEGRQSVFIFWQQRDDESKMVKHAHVGPQFWVVGDNFVGQVV